MLRAHIDKQSAVPWWAAFGAPLFGVPMLVALLALGGSGHGDVQKQGAVEPTDSFTSEQVEAAPAVVGLPLAMEGVVVLESRC